MRRAALVLISCVALIAPPAVQADDEAAAAQKKLEQEQEAKRRAAAVTLNYCRASLYRIRRYPSRHVLLDEKQRILNNLDLNAIEDSEVIQLYSALLDEINQDESADKDREVIVEQNNRSLQRKLGAQLFVIGAQIATGQMISAVQSGANSWWDFRNTEVSKDQKVWQLERSKQAGINSRSSRFLDAAWKLSRKNEIPDSWLIRDDDLARLEHAMREPRPDVRLRVLRRMTRFMECYPPFWYYMARTEQQLGQLAGAAETYKRLTHLADGHFRTDEMLAAGTANLAMIQEYLGSDDAAKTARQALAYSTEAWEVNITCAWILNRHDGYIDAEDAILRNLDVDLEKQQSSIALVSLYYHAGDRAKLTRTLANEELVRRIPVPGLLLCAGLLGNEGYPRSVRQHLASSLQGVSDLRFGRDSIALRSSPDWKLGDARIRLSVGERQLQQPRLHVTSRSIEARFSGAGDLGHPLKSSGGAKTLVVTLEYPQTPTIRLHLHRDPGRPRIVTGEDGRIPKLDASATYRLSSIEVGDRRLSVLPAAADRS